MLARWPIWSYLGFSDGRRRVSSVPTAPELSWRDGRARKEAPFGLRRVKARAGLTDTGSNIWVPSALIGCDPNPYGSKVAGVRYGSSPMYELII